ncbi:ATP-binding protein [Candidatus Magnetomorum sp. HK-1]|nr:ATP-binding protein [Candidatus Magnetomorum sp. HK-1]
MLKSLQIKNMTAFSDATFEFVPGLNVIVGENITGKSHVLKMGYCILHSLYQLNVRQTLKQTDILDASAIQHSFSKMLTEKILNVFKPDALGNLIQSNDNLASEIKAEITKENDSQLITFSFRKNDHQLMLDKFTKLSIHMPLFIPTNEVLTMLPEFPELYEKHYMSIDETYYDLCKALRMPLLKQSPDELKKTVESLEDVLGGKIVVQKTGHAYIQFSDNKQLEISLIAEGLRKLSTLIYLLRNGTISKGCTIFWDEAENNLNPKYMTKIASTLFSLVQSGIQVVIVTHSLFLMKELSLLSEISSGKTFCRFFNCNPGKNNIIVDYGDLLEDLPSVTSLHEALLQDDREQAFYQNQ